jgi:regulation of enolase protein 1 (concanavalin A-like superfamily)
MTPGSVSYDAATGTYTMTGAGSNIWGQADEFHFAFKELNGDGSITVRVEGISANPPHGDPRIGVMIRDSLDPNAANALLFIEPDPRTRLTQRVQVAGNTTDVAVAADVGKAPTWLRLTRQGFAFKAEGSDNGTTWAPLLAAGSEASIAMTDPVYLGLVVCSHASGQFIEATFSNVKTTGQVTPAGPFTTSRDIGIASNSPQPLYVTLRDKANHTATVTKADLANTSAWTAWDIPLADFTGVNPAAVKTMIIGVGDKNPDGTGLVYIDDIRVTKP